MKHINSADLRQSIGRIVEQIEETGEPILLDKHGAPVAAIISLKDFKERFVDKQALEERRALAQKINGLARTSKANQEAVEVLRELREST